MVVSPATTITTTTTTSVAALRSRLQTFRSSLQSFLKSTSDFRILHTVNANGAIGTGPIHQRPSRLFVLDSSYNPPTRAHLQIVVSALRSYAATTTATTATKAAVGAEEESATAPAPAAAAAGVSGAQHGRVLLLLSTKNADKAPQPAGFEHRLVMMTALAHQVLDEIGKMASPQAMTTTTTTTTSGRAWHRGRLDPAESVVVAAVDIAVTKLPYFVDKCTAIENAGSYHRPSSSSSQQQEDEALTEQIHLVGYDTLVRILDPKYYPPDHSLERLRGLFRAHRLRVTDRPDDSWGGRSEQAEFVARLRGAGSTGSGSGSNNDGQRGGGEDGEGEEEEEEEKGKGYEGIKGWRPEWADRIELVQGGQRREGQEEQEEEEAISSTAARKAAGKANGEVLRRVCPELVADWVLEEKLYAD